MSKAKLKAKKTAADGKRGGAANPPASHRKITEPYLLRGIAQVGKHAMSLPREGKSSPIAVVFENEKKERLLTYDPSNSRFFGVREWYKKSGAQPGDTVTVEEIRPGKLYRLRIAAADSPLAAEKKVPPRTFQNSRNGGGKNSRVNSASDRQRKGAAGAPASQKTLTLTDLQYGIARIGKHSMALPGGDKSLRVSILFDDSDREHQLTYDPSNPRFFGVRGWYKACGAQPGDIVTAEEVRPGELYRLRIAAARPQAAEEKISSRSFRTPEADFGKSKKTGRIDSVTGEPINFRGLVYAPANEAGVVLLFGMVYQELGLYVESVQAAFPDAVIRRFNGRAWVRELVEFEYASANFRNQRHPADKCDIIVCWRHNWKNCPLEVCDLSQFVKTLPPDKRRQIDAA